MTQRPQPYIHVVTVLVHRLETAALYFSPFSSFIVKNVPP
jgi:hypothetical protein